MHQLFSELLGQYSIKEKTKEPIQQVLKVIFETLNDTNRDLKDSFTRGLKNAEEKIEKVEENFALGEIDRSLYEKLVQKFGKEKQEIEQKIVESSFELSNFFEYINYGVNLASELPARWLSEKYETKIEIQNLVFPEGIRFNKSKNDYRTFHVNSLFSTIPTVTGILDKKRSGLSTKIIEKSALVALNLPESNNLIRDFMKIIEFKNRVRF
jgi:hypothetical protein